MNDVLSHRPSKKVCVLTPDTSHQSCATAKQSNHPEFYPVAPTHTTTVECRDCRLISDYQYWFDQEYWYICVPERIIHFGERLRPVIRQHVAGARAL